MLNQIANRRIDRLCESVEEFVDHMTFLGKMNSEMSIVEEDCQVVGKLFNLAMEYGMKISLEDCALHRILFPSLQQLKVILVIIILKNLVKFNPS